MNPSMDSWSAFVAAAGTGPVLGRGAGAWQGAIGRQHADLEPGNRSGGRAFDRTGRNPVLIAAGSRLLPEARVIP